MNVNVFGMYLTLYWLPTVYTASCQDGWLSHQGECFLFSHDLETWIGAMEICRLMGATLAEVESADENRFLVGQIKSLGGSFWIGLTDLGEEGTFRWAATNTRLAQDSYTNWHDNNHNSLSDNCVHYVANQGQWDDAQCSHTQKYICEQSSDASSQIIG